MNSNTKKTIEEEVREMMDLLWAYSDYQPEAYLIGDCGPIRIELGHDNVLPICVDLEEQFPNNKTKAENALVNYIRERNFEYCLFLNPKNQPADNQFAIERLGATPCGYAKVTDNMSGEEMGVYMLFRVE